MASRRSSTRRGNNEQLTFALYAAANRMIRKHKPFLEPLGLTFPQYLVMVELLSGAPLSVGELGNKVGMDTGTISPLVKRLELSGLVTKQRCVKDERRASIALTTAGAGLRERIWAVPGQMNAVCQISDQRSDEIREMLHEMAASEERVNQSLG